VTAEKDPVLKWLLEGDPAIRWQVRRDLLGQTGAGVEGERRLMARAGWGRQLLALQQEDGRWGGGLYTPKWTSTTYSLLLLHALGLSPGNRQANAGALLLLDEGLNADGGINLWRRWSDQSETCVTGMVLAIASRFAPATRGSTVSPRTCSNSRWVTGAGTAKDREARPTVPCIPPS
jgi:hypothetical protein